MPRSNIPYRSMRYFSNRKHTGFARSHVKGNCDTRLVDNQEGQSCPVNNILVLPKNSETTINVVSTDNRSCSYGNLLKKIKGRKRKEKQRMKKKSISESDVKPVVNKVNPASCEKMKPRLNKHIIFLSDSDNENNDSDNRKTLNDSSNLNDISEKGNCDLNNEDDDVIFVETPAAEVIEIDDSTEQNDSSEQNLNDSNALEKSNDQENSLDANDFLDNAQINLKSNFNFELHGSEFKGAEFLKPSTVPIDMSESGSVSSVSDVSAPIGMNVFNLFDFPQEKDNLFDDNNLEKFRKAITPQRLNKKSGITLKDTGNVTPEHKKNPNDTLPTLSDIHDGNNSRKQRGRSIIKELVNDRAYVLLSTAQKKLKNKKRKSKDEISDTFEEENASDSQELIKKKKKKKSKKQDPLPNEINLEIRNDTEDDGKNKKQKEVIEVAVDKCPIIVRTDLFESSPMNKKSKKNKRQDCEAIVDEENTDKRKRKLKKSMDEPLEDCAKRSKIDQPHILLDTEEKKKKKNRKTSETCVEMKKNDSLCVELDIQENNEERKKKKVKKSVPTDPLEEKLISVAGIIQNENEPLVNRKTTEKEHGDEIKKNDSLCVEVNIQDCNEERKKKKAKKSVPTDLLEEKLISVAGIIQNENEPLVNRKTTEKEHGDEIKKNDSLCVEVNIQDCNEERKKKKVKKSVPTDLLEEKLISVAGIIQNENEPLVNRKTTEKEHGDEIKKNDSLCVEVNIQENNEERKKKKVKKSVPTDLSEEKLISVAGITQNENEPLVNRKTTEKEHGDEIKKNDSLCVEVNIQDCNEERKKKKVKKSVPTDLLEEKLISVAGIIQNENEPLVNRKTTEKEHGDEIKKNDSLCVEVNIQDCNEERKKKKVKKSVPTDLLEEKLISVAGIIQNENEPLVNRKTTEKEHGDEIKKNDSLCVEVNIQENNEERKKKKVKKSVPTDLSEEKLISVAGITQNENEPLVNTKTTEKEHGDEIKKKAKKSVSRDLSEDKLISIAEISQHENEPSENRKDKEKEENDTTQDKKCVEDSLCSQNKIINKILEKSEKVLDETENILIKSNTLEVKEIVEEQVVLGDSTDVNTSEKLVSELVISDNIDNCNSDIGKKLEVCQFVGQIQELKKNNQEFEISVDVENIEKRKRKIKNMGGPSDNGAKISENNYQLNILLDFKTDRITSEKSSEHIMDEKENVPHSIEASIQENTEEGKKKTKRNSEVSVEANESKRIKLIDEEISKNDEKLLENKKESNVDNTSRENDITQEKKSMEVENETLEKADKDLDKSEHIVNTSNIMEEKDSIVNISGKKNSEELGNIKDIEILNTEIGTKLENSQLVDSVVVVNNEGNIDMKLSNVFSVGSKSIFPEQTNFVDDDDINNFSDKNSTSWNTNPSKFSSYNGSLFNDANTKETLEESVEILPEVTILNSTLLPNPNLSENVELECINLKDIDETIIVKEEQQNTNVINPSDVSLEGDVLVKVEQETHDLIKSIVGTNSKEPFISIETCCEELPNEIEEIFNEKDNHDTVKRLCEFLEEVRDPNEVLKKVSLLKQAFRDKSQDSGRINEITDDNDDILSISSSGSSVMCLDDDVSIVGIDDDITLANCDLIDVEKNEAEINKIPDVVAETGLSNDGALKRNDKVEISRCKSILNSTIKSRESPHYEKGLDKYEVEDIQGCMSGDPKLWKIVAEDIYPVKLPAKGKRCIKCREIGHLGYNCPNRLNLPNCPLCGIEGHLDFRCPNRICTQCGRKTPTLQSVCDHCKHYKSLTCVLCGNKGHPKNKCPDLWRRYHLTVNHGPLVQRDALKLKDKKNLWCSSCARSGHVESECRVSWKKIRNFQPLDPRVHHYEDIYKTKPILDRLESVQPNIEEIPQTSQNFRNNDGSSTSSSSSSSNENLISSNNLTEQALSIPNTDDGLQNLPPEFEVIDEVNEENQDIVVDAVDRDCHALFMTDTVESLKHFLRAELSLLESSKFEIKNIHLRFFAFQEDDKRAKSKFTVSRKQQFYKQLNMLLFGKLQVKCGKVHKDKLKHFVNSTYNSLTTPTRESLYYSYDYIFRNTPHDYVNYKFFVKMIRDKYGNQKWLF